MGGIKYYQLAKGEEMPDEFCVVRDVGGEPSEYVFYVPDAENAKLRNLAHILCHCMQIHTECDDCRLNGSKGELAFDPLCACDGLHELLREAGIEVS